MCHHHGSGGAGDQGEWRSESNAAFLLGKHQARMTVASKARGARNPVEPFPVPGDESVALFDLDSTSSWSVGLSRPKVPDTAKEDCESCATLSHPAIVDSASNQTSRGETVSTRRRGQPVRQGNWSAAIWPEVSIELQPGEIDFELLGEGPKGVNTIGLSLAKVYFKSSLGPALVRLLVPEVADERPTPITMSPLHLPSRHNLAWILRDTRLSR